MEREHHQPSINEALSELAGIEGGLHVTGAVDTEPAALEAIRQKLMRGEISPEEAVKSARSVVAGRQDYH